MSRLVLVPAVLTLAFAAVLPGQDRATAGKPAPRRKAERPAGPYLVLVDPGKDDEFLPAARAMGAIHGGTVKRFDPAKLDATLAVLRESPPRFVVFVLPPEKIDVDLAHDLLTLATRVDDDPFVDFEYGFVTGRDGAAALRFVERIAAAWKHEFGKKAALLGSWEGPILPVGQPLSAFKALGLSGKDYYVRARDSEEARLKAAREALASLKGNDALLFFSHGYPDEMALCFRARDLKEWQADLSPAVLFNCACYNGAPGRWFAPGPGGVVDKGVVARDDSVALALLDSGVVGYFAGIDPWHGPLAMQVFYHVTDDGMRLGEAAKRMHDRLALDFLPGRIHYEPALKTKDRFSGEGTANRRHNGAGMILYGDPALAPFAKTASRLTSAEVQAADKDPMRVKLSVRPLVDGQPGADFMLATSRLTDYYSVKTADYLKELALEVYRVLPLPPGTTAAPSLRVASARSGDEDLPTGPLQLVVEDTPQGKFLHVRVPLQVRAVDYSRLMSIATKGLTIELDGKL
jgi:hypothetical protein